ncbi:unnamed protein product [Tuber melanosporum]|uniref:(Perigord truffle) hypothetical protein n=1 Tax=Tuber melanosporum (strain Mel28) TaxID=656061 RepID=D5GEC5_TUBMM|nr:uncharacterized protein GSTUM_00001265001 [Tuber melanosporum]CAZ82868.1 unnamed protein product [Tuber melanosporum]
MLTLEKAHPGSERMDPLPTDGEILALQKLAERNERRVERLGIKLYELESKGLSREQADRKIVRYLMKATEFVEAVNERVEMACAGKLPAQATVQSVQQMVGSVDACVRRVDGQLYLLHTSRPFSPLLEEILGVMSSQLPSEGESNGVGNATGPRAGFMDRLCRSIRFLV